MKFQSLVLKLSDISEFQLKGIVSRVQEFVSTLWSTRRDSWKLLSLVLLASCAASEQTETPSAQSQQGDFRIRSTVDLRLLSPSEPVGGQPARREFRRGDTEGWMTIAGLWSLRTPVQHSRLLCAIYETGIRLGRGDPVCTNVRWLTETEFSSRRRHCNSAVMIHLGEGRFPEGPQLFSEANCVRVVTRCQGIC